jgi:hypothetical protein
MGIDEPLRVSIAIDCGVAPVSGRVIAGGGDEQAFEGWTELFAALQAAVTGDERKGKDRC